MSGMVTVSLRKKGSPLVDVDQHGWQIQHAHTSPTTPNHTSGKPNAAADKKMMEQQHSTTDFHAMMCSSGEPNFKIQQTDQREETACNSPAACD